MNVRSKRKGPSRGQQPRTGLILGGKPEQEEQYASKSYPALHAMST